jgi:hypothetical protein
MPHTQLLSIVYLSTAAAPLDTDDLAKLLDSSRTNNMLTHLTGMLLYREGRFLQVLEGPEVFVRGRMAVIAADPRHTGVQVLLEETIGERRFPRWTMRHEDVSPETSREIPGFRRMFETAHDDEASGERIASLRTLIRWFQERAEA